MPIPRSWIASIVAPPVAVIVFWAGMFAFEAITSPQTLPAGTGAHTLFFFLLFGVPLSYVGAYLLALPTYLVLERRQLLSTGKIVVASTIIGAVWPLLLMLIFENKGTGENLRFLAFFVGLGAAAGLCAGVAFNVLAGRRYT